MGFGHRVYKNYDPRARIIKAAADTILAKLGTLDDPLLEIAKELEEVALNDSYFVDHKLYPNVDFYSGLIYRALGFPTEDVHRPVRDRPPARLDRPLAGDDARPADADRAAAPDLHRRARSARTCRSRSADVDVLCPYPRLGG